MADTMTQWEKEWMQVAPQDCLRTFVLNPTAPGGFSEYGETMLDFESTETLTEDNGEAKVSLLKVDAPAPLSNGTFLRMYLFGSITDGVPVWQVDENGEPKNYRNYYVRNGNSRWFQKHPTGHVDRYRHDYDCEEVLACLKDYPIRSVKTFAEGAYTFKQCLEIAFELAFRPRSVGVYSFTILDFPGLDNPNTKLEYVNSTLYDVVTDIGRIIDAVPSMEITYMLGGYVFELRFVDRYGLEGEVHDISYFNDKIHDAVNIQRDTNAGASISNVQNLIVGEGSAYPSLNGLKPIDTNLDRSWEYFQLPYPVDTVREVSVYWRYDMDKGANPGAGGSRVYFYDGTNIISYRRYSNILFVDPIVIPKDGYAEEWLYSENDIDYRIAKKKRLYLREYDEYSLLPDIDSNTQPTRQNTIYYTRGDNRVYLQALFNNTYRYWYHYNLAGGQPNYQYARFSASPNSSPEISGQNNNQFYIAVKFNVMLNGVIKGLNSKPSDLTVFFNQQGQVVSIQSFGNAVNNYTKTMFGENRIVTHTYANIGREAMYTEMPKVGSSILDHERGKRYVLTDMSFIRRMNGGQLLATLAESRAGKSRYIIADNRQRCYAIPDKSIVDSMSHSHVICKMGVKSPFDWNGNLPLGLVFPQENRKTYLFNAFVGAQHTGEYNPQTVDLDINVKNGDTIDLNGIEIFTSRFRLNAMMSMRMLGNSAYAIKDGEPILYTDSDGQFNSLNMGYKTESGTPIFGVFQKIKKDSYEIFNHTTQVSWVEYGNLQINDSIVDMSYFGKGAGLDQPLQLVLLSSRMRINDPLNPHVAARYNLEYQYNTTSLQFTASELTSIPEHVGWAIVRGDVVILLDNFDVLTDNTITVYYQIEVRD
mgnify:CR=1 FL=1